MYVSVYTLFFDPVRGIFGQFLVKHIVHSGQPLGFKPENLTSRPRLPSTFSVMYKLNSKFLSLIYHTAK